MDLVAQIDKRIAAIRSVAAYAEYEDGFEDALLEVRPLVVAYVSERIRMDAECSETMHSLLQDEAAQRVQVEEASQKLARALGMVHPGPHTLSELVDKAVAEVNSAARDRRRMFEDWN